MYTDSMKELRLSTGRKIIVDYDEDSYVSNPRDFYPVTKLIGISKCNTLVLDEVFDSVLELFDKRDEAIKQGHFVFDLFAYKHSSTVLSIYPFADKWDSAKVGFCIVEKSDLIDNEKRAREMAESELETFSKWLNGEVFKVLVAHPEGFDTVIDDCIGGCFINNEDDLRDVLDCLDLTEGERREALDNLDKLMP